MPKFNLTLFIGCFVAGFSQFLFNNTPLGIFPIFAVLAGISAISEYQKRVSKVTASLPLHVIISATTIALFTPFIIIKGLKDYNPLGVKILATMIGIACFWLYLDWAKRTLSK